MDLEKRISNGAGVDISKINKLLKQFKMMFEMMKKMSQGKIPSGMPLMKYLKI